MAIYIALALLHKQREDGFKTERSCPLQLFNQNGKILKVVEDKKNVYVTVFTQSFRRLLTM